MATKKLSERELSFCRNMLTEKDQTEAAIKAGYSEKTAASQASRLLRKVNIQKEISRLREKEENDVISLRKRLRERLVQIAFSDPSDVMTWNESGIDMIPSTKLTKEKRSLIRSLSHTTTATGESFKCEMQPQLDAIKELNKMDGNYAQQELPEGVTGVMFYVPNNGRD